MAYFIQSALFSCIYTVYLYLYIYTRRIHGAGIYANIWGILMGSMLPYIAYMDPMGYINTSPNRQGKKRPGFFSCQMAHLSEIPRATKHWPLAVQTSLSTSKWIFEYIYIYIQIYIRFYMHVHMYIIVYIYIIIHIVYMIIHIQYCTHNIYIYVYASLIDLPNHTKGGCSGPLLGPGHTLWPPASCPQSNWPSTPFRDHHPQWRRMIVA